MRDHVRALKFTTYTYFVQCQLTDLQRPLRWSAFLLDQSNLNDRDEINSVTLLTSKES